MRTPLACLLLICFVGSAHSQNQASTPDPLATALRREVDALGSGNPKVLDVLIAWPERIREFYARRSFKPAWTDSKSSAELQRALKDSRLDGLDPEDYHLTLLQKLAQDTAAKADVRAKFDLLQTEALVRLAYHLSFGKVDPASFDAQWNYGRKIFGMEAERWIETTLANRNVYEQLDALRPKHPLYVSLKRELARYRSIQSQGGWSAVPRGATIKPGGDDPRIPALRARLIASGDLDASAGAESTTYDATVQSAMRRFQARLGLDEDAVIGARTIEDLNVPIADRIEQMRVNLDRGRVLLHDLPNAFVIVNIAAYQIYVVRGRDVVWESRVQVGKPYRRTPIFRSQIEYLVWNPTWTVPPGIAKNDILPQAQRDPSSITRKGLEVFDANGRKLDPNAIDWSKYRSGIPYTLRQPPGPTNALGRVKFMFPNSYAVYLHDTPSRTLFESVDRSFSSGCVRVERPIELALLLLNDPTEWNEKSVARTIETLQTTNVTLPEKMPLLLAYWTAWIDAEDRVNFRRDVYGQDARWMKGLDAPFTVRKQRKE